MDIIPKILIGGGRYAVETFYLMEDAGMPESFTGFAVDKPEPGQLLLGRPVLSIAGVVEEYGHAKEKPAVLVAIGDTMVNKRMAQLFRQSGFSFFNVIHKEVNLGRQKHIGEGVTIATGTLLTCNISIGNHVIINIGCTVSHDCVIGDHVNISPGCHLAGNVHIEEDVFVGTGATFIPKVKVGRGSIIAAGACVTKDVPPYTMAAGVPAIIKKQLR